ncbi:unnamed protein product [Ceutorhynchus assimilis]|uniref:acylphosphatase n=1 Tax=Ceutorhynchus assimilis TaxID=467358 RepID=A0A9N9QMD7_9CUCU|nr:unnamed protein product [Ceutorhynchus assimilis]
MSDQLIVLPKFKRFLAKKCYCALLLIVLTPSISYIMSSSEKLTTVSFEVFGTVQGVFFRKYTEQEAKRLGLRGWCMNTNQKTVKGVLEGNPNKIADMKNWLQTTGSPESRIDKAVFTDERNIEKFSFKSFTIKR